MRIPQWDIAGSSACASGAHNRLPHVLACVDACLPAMRLNRADQVLHVLAIRRVVGAPAAATAWVRLNIYPDHAIARVQQFSSFIFMLEVAELHAEPIDKAAYLRGGALPAAGEHVDIDVGDPSILGIPDIGGGARVEGAIASPGAGDDEGVAVPLETAKVTEALGDIDAARCEDPHHYHRENHCDFTHLL